MSTFPPGSPHADCQDMIARRHYAEAIQALRPRVETSPDAEGHALLAVAHFQSEAYGDAARHYAAALHLAPDRAEWTAMLKLARENAHARIDVPVPDFQYFDRTTLLAPPHVPPGSLPAPLPPPSPPGLLQRLRTALGNASGAVVAVVMHAVTTTWGRLAGYRDAVWTNWYRRSLTRGLITIAYMRDQLNARNLKNTYPAGQLTGFVPQNLPPPAGVTHFRTADGSWNNLQNPREGAAGTRLMRNVDPRAAQPETGEQLLTPNPRVVSRALLSRRGPMREVPFLNLLAASWIQFQNSDWINHGEILFRDVHEVPLPPDDPARQRYWQTKMFVGKTQPDPTRQPEGESMPVSFINEVTHWWDASQLYGSDLATQQQVRSGIDGKLRLTPEGTLPLDAKGVEVTGFTRNWWVGVSLWHTLFTHEHNALCDLLRARHPDWDDNRLFNVARLINAAVIAKIHTVEWTPAVLPNPGLDAALNANWYGLLTNFLRVGKQRKTLASINVRNPEMGGVVGNPIDKHGQPFGLTEEFTEVYRLHSLLPETLQVRRLGDAAGVESIPFVETRQSGSARLTARVPVADLLYSFGRQHPGQLVLNNYPQFLQELSIPGNPFFDMGTVDILRARERGVPRYNEFRRQLGLNPLRTFEDLTDDADQVRRLKEVYGHEPEAVEKLDLLIGTLGEGHRPTHFGFGETMFQIFILNATRRLQADRFYTDCYRAEYYTEEGLRWIDDTDLKSVLLRHYPELATTGLANIKNAFEPWDTGDRLEPERHPLRACDPELKADPWTVRRDRA